MLENMKFRTHNIYESKTFLQDEVFISICQFGPDILDIINLREAFKKKKVWIFATPPGPSPPHPPKVWKHIL